MSSPSPPPPGHRRWSPSPTPGWAGSGAAPGHDRAPDACASCAEPTGLPPDTTGRHASRSPGGLFVRAAHAAFDSRSEASDAPASPAPRAVPCRGPDEAHTDNSNALHQEACRPCVRSADTGPRRTPRLLSDRQAPSVFSDHRFQRLAVKAQLRNQQLQTAVLVLHRLKPLRLAHFHPAVLRLPAIKCCRADPMLPANIRRLHPSLMLLQDPDDLLLCVPALLHAPSSRLDYERTPVSTGRDFRRQVKRVLARIRLGANNSPCSPDESPNSVAG